MRRLKGFWLVCFVLVLIGCGKKVEVPTISVQEQYVLDHPNLSDEMKQNIKGKIVCIGMTEEQVLISWGMPIDIQIFTSEYNSYKRWVYPNRPKVYWKDGKVVSLIQ
jgi:hypothetical protein